MPSSVLTQAEIDAQAERAKVRLATVYDQNKEVDGWVAIKSLLGYKVSDEMMETIAHMLNSLDKKNAVELGHMICAVPSGGTGLGEKDTIRPGIICVGDECSVQIKDCQHHSYAAQAGAIHTHPNKIIGSSLGDVYSALNRMMGQLDWQLTREIAQRVNNGQLNGSEEIQNFERGYRAEPEIQNINCNLVRWDSKPTTGELTCLVKLPGVYYSLLKQTMEKIEALLRQGVPGSMPGEMAPNFSKVFGIKEIPLFTNEAINLLYMNPDEYTRRKEDSWPAEIGALWSSDVADEQKRARNGDKIGELKRRAENLFVQGRASLLEVMKQACRYVSSESGEVKDWLTTICQNFDKMNNEPVWTKLNEGDRSRLCTTDTHDLMAKLREEAELAYISVRHLRMLDQALKYNDKKNLNDFFTASEPGKARNMMSNVMDTLDTLEDKTLNYTQMVNKFRDYWRDTCHIWQLPTNSNRKHWASPEPVVSETVEGFVISKRITP